jgi:cytochrome c-type biogenesis protein CcmE
VVSAPAIATNMGGAADRRRRLLFGLGALAVAGGAFVAIAVGGIGANLVYYWGPSEVQAAGDSAVGATVRLGGQVVAGSVRRAAGVSGLEFAVTDGRATVPVRSEGLPPQMFREGIGVVVEGTMTSEGVFAGSRLLVAHGNDYQAPSSPATADARRQMRTTQGLDADPAAEGRPR